MASETHPTQCEICRRWFVPMFSTTGVSRSCCVLHPAGDCCHYNDREVPSPVHFVWTFGRLAWMRDAAFLPVGYIRLYEWLVWRLS